MGRLFRITKIIIVLVLMMLIIMPYAAAGTSTEGGNANMPDGEKELLEQLQSLPPFKFEKHKEGIGYGRCPVYSAPSSDAYRCANGKAVCNTDSAMDDAGYVSGWLLVRYETNNGDYRVGYIPPKYVKDYKSKMAPHFGYIPAVAEDTIYVTDNPMTHGTSFAVLAEGESFHILSKYDYYKKNGLEWWYIECDVDGQTARGFIEYSDSLFRLGY